MRGATTVITALMLVGLASVPVGTDLTRNSAVTDLLLHSIWDRALTGTDQSAPLPWGASNSAASTSVARLGMSAAVLDDSVARGTGLANGLKVEPARSVVSDVHAAPIPLDKVGVGDRITITNANGLAEVYEVTDRHLLDPDKAGAAAGSTEAGFALITCKPLQSDAGAPLHLVIQAVHVEPTAHLPAGHEQKL